MKGSDDGYELMKQVFAETGIIYEEGVPADKVGFYAVKNGVEIKLPDNFLKGFNTERSDSHE